MVGKSLGKLVGRLTDTESDDEETTPKTDGGVNVQLFECSHCAVTYVSKSKDSCSQCGQPVNPIQNERDLGLIGNNFQ